MRDVPKDSKPADLSEEAVARMLRAAWIADEPIPAAGSFDEIGPLMRKAWMATAAAVLALVREKVREAADAAVRAVRFDSESLAVAQSAEGARNMVASIVADVMGDKEAPRG